MSYGCAVGRVPFSDKQTGPVAAGAGGQGQPTSSDRTSRVPFSDRQSVGGGGYTNARERSASPVRKEKYLPPALTPRRDNDRAKTMPSNGGGGWADKEKEKKITPKKELSTFHY